MNKIRLRNSLLLLLPLMALAGAPISSLVGAETSPRSGAPIDWPHSRASQIVFFAVLEGLYGDGVSNADVDRIIPPGKNGPKFDSEHFIYACPLCHPAYEAFRLYRQRERIYGLKAPIDTFGKGLDESVSARLRSQDAGQRRQVIEELINRWVGERLNMMRLSDSERRAITSEMEQGRKQGMGGLKQASQQSGQSRTNCPICDGSFGACKLRLN
jgi:hypothetical protein